VAWFPLAPGEVYWPSYTNDLAEIRRINTGSVDDVSTIDSAVDGQPPADIVNGDYENRRFASVVPRSAFTGSRPVVPTLLHLPATRLANAPLLAGSPQLAPPPPRVVVTAATIAGAAARLAAVAPRRLARAMPVVGRILSRKGRATVVRPAILVRPAPVQGKTTPVLTQQSHRHSARPARPQPVPAVASSTRHVRRHLAAAQRR
jgi:hypothetical protein